MPTRTGATSCESLPMKAPSSMIGRMLRDAVVVAGDRAGADVHALANRGVAEIREVSAPWSRGRGGLLQLDEVPDVRVLADVRVAAESARTVRPARPAPRSNSTITQKLLIDHAIVDRGVDDADAGVNLTAGPNPRAALEVHVRMDDGVRANRRRPARRRRSPGPRA